MTHKITLTAILIAFAGCTPATNLIFNEGSTDPRTGTAIHELLICNAPKGLDWELWGNFYDSCELPGRDVEGSMAKMTLFSGSCWRVDPMVAADTVVLRYVDAAHKLDWSPDGFYLKTRKNGKVTSVSVSFNFQPSDTLPDIKYKKVELALQDMIPSVKNCEVSGEGTEIAEVENVDVPGMHPEGYRLSIGGGKAVIEASDANGFLYGQTTLDRLFENAGSRILPDMKIEDWPDMEYRAQMIDVSRLFYPVDELKKIIDVMARCKMNTLALHLNDDENWRLQIDGLPELTEFGAFHALPERQADGSYVCTTAVPPVKGGALGRKSKSSTSGFYSISDYQDLLKYAAARGIRIIPEIDIPGHCYSAVEAMKARERNTGDSSCRLICPDDKSEYCSVQGFSGNVLDLSLPSVYTFLGKVFDSIKAMYEGASMTLEEIAVGGDEVADGAWKGSPACIAEMQEKGFTELPQLRSLFIQRVNSLLRERNIRISGYNEIVENISPEAFDEICANCGHIWAWKRINRSLAGVAYDYANKGLNVILANCTHTYLELARNKSRVEPGLVWANTLDERKTYAFLPFSIGRTCRFDSDNKPCDPTALDACVPVLERTENIKGIQAMLWADNLWTTEAAYETMFPKAYGLYERSWNARPEWEGSTEALDPAFTNGFNRFYTTVAEREYPYLDAAGLRHRTELEQE